MKEKTSENDKKMNNNILVYNENNLEDLRFTADFESPLKVYR